METYEVDTARKRHRHLRVPVFPEEAQIIEENAKRAGMSVARYLREVGQGYKITGIVDYQHVREMVRISGDLGRLGGLLKLWLADDPRTARFGDATILALLAKIEEKQDELGKVMMRVVRPKA
ncbi:conjugal transfer transcriptional regulator TraJ [Pseudomonas aeruginosa]|uniref:conjugal transfer transcriptional regulator TraJ n=1 Tax=Pseudomonas TaxID=286 RepID=UPI0003B95DFD|nr:MULTISPECIES: conjugal transfer transcriptional regulator TraJ [Pseudomonas]ALZ27339.1 conjugal transfer protein TrbJ [Pseudomonas aeruginosa]AOT39204.1 conjugal transfer protein TraJ [Pseudomonas aeruginosa]AXC19555.1 conjugal transfer protein TraJ [Pseudomonas aeruginosa]EIU7110096.1 conjugal transfer transcriptional regulator TraJ [Pseudomonas aeruginosa]EKU2270364.1 conjugal transfer transcriptional regulator TraJ [Pseudomonas aeruginosa]